MHTKQENGLLELAVGFMLLALGYAILKGLQREQVTPRFARNEGRLAEALR